jgi:gamma-glutamyltranspeptidase/glutathione hydrolase
VARDPVRATYRGREVLTNPPPSAGGTLLALAMARLDERSDGAPSAVDIVAVMEEVQGLRTPEFVAGLTEPGFADRFLAARLGSTTHISVLDREGRACAVTCTNGEGSGLVVPGTGIHVNNVMGEQDLNPLGFFAFPPGRRMPSMMAPTVVLGTGGEVELVLGSAGSNRIRSAILQVIVGVVDHGLRAQDAVLAPRLHFEDGLVYAEPGVDADALRATGRRLVAFRDRNLFFGGAQAVERDRHSGTLSGAGDPRRGGAAVAA